MTGEKAYFLELSSCLAGWLVGWNGADRASGGPGHAHFSASGPHACIAATVAVVGLSFTWAANTTLVLTAAGPHHSMLGWSKQPGAPHGPPAPQQANRPANQPARERRWKGTKEGWAAFFFFSFLSTLSPVAQGSAHARDPGVGVREPIE